MLVGSVQNNLVAQEIETLALVAQVCQAALMRLACPSCSSSPGLFLSTPMFAGEQEALDLSPSFGNFLGALTQDSESVHITQVYDEKYNPGGAPRSSDCGPTALAMCLKGLGLGQGGPQDRIDDARYQMFAGVEGSKDGVDANGNKSQSEHSTSTNIADVRRGAERMGARTSDITNVEQVAQALEAGAMVALAGKNSGDIYGHGIDFNGGHFIAVSAYDRSTDMFTINDPLSHQGPFQVTRTQLRQYMWDQDGAGVDGLAITR